MEVGDLIGGRYELLGRIGVGPLTRVYKAHDTALDRLVVVKVLQPELAERREVAYGFQQVAQQLTELSHPNLAAVYAVGNEGEAPYLVAEYLAAGTLRDRLEREGALSADRALDIAVAVAAGVRAYHLRGLLHGRLRPQNVMFTDQGDIKITDGGVAHILAALSAGSGAISSELAPYLPPEGIAGQLLVPASDVYAIGVICYEMLAGHPPFQASSPAETALMHLHQEAPPLQGQDPTIPTPLAHIVHKMLAKDPRGRYASAQQLHHILLTYQRQRASLEGRSGPTPVAQTERPRHAEAPSRAAVAGPSSEEGMDWPFVLLGLLAILAILGLILLWTVVYRRYTMPLG